MDQEHSHEGILEKCYLKISQNSQEIIYNSVLFSLVASWNFIKKSSIKGVFRNNHSAHEELLLKKVPIKAKLYEFKTKLGRAREEGAEGFKNFSRNIS